MVCIVYLAGITQCITLLVTISQKYWPSIVCLTDILPMRSSHSVSLKPPPLSPAASRPWSQYAVGPLLSLSLLLSHLLHHVLEAPRLNGGTVEEDNGGASLGAWGGDERETDREEEGGGGGEGRIGR